jgi:hypothetical protein
MKHGLALAGASFTWLALSATAFAQAAAPGSTLQSGGLRPPDAIETTPNTQPASQTEAQLDRADKEDSGRGLEFVWVNAEVGPQYLGLQTLKASGLVDGSSIESKGLGMSYGAGVGVRLLVFTLGARFRFASFSDWQVWTLGPEVGMHIPLGRLEPYFTLGAGYASLGGYDKSLALVPEGAKGLNVRAGAGLDFYLTNTFSVGANLSGDLLFLSRSASARPAGDPGAMSPYFSDGSGIGLGGTLSAVLGLHF